MIGRYEIGFADGTEQQGRIDAAWKKARVVARYGEQPWGPLNGKAASAQGRAAGAG